MKKILFVCTGNTCRSPMAAAVLRDIIRQAGKTAEAAAASAGLTATDGEPAAENAILAARSLGMDLEAHRARRLTAAMVQEADVVLTMTAKHRDAILAVMPEAADKVAVFTVYAGFNGDITDPFGGDLVRYTQCLQDMRQCMQGVWQRILRLED